PKDYLVSLKAFAQNIGAVLIFDEITSGFRMCAGGIHLNYGINPDIAIFAKSMANGYAMASVIGTEKVMSSAQSSFISSTNWTERIGPVAALATIKKYISKNVAEHIIKIGNDVKSVWSKMAENHRLSINVSGLPTLAAFSFTNENNQAMMTLFTIEMLKKGFLGFRQFKSSFAHTSDDISKYEKAVDDVFQKISITSIDELLSTPVAHSGLYRLTKE
ncbi:MAG: aminotransferase class III-fold pyridoxal phosphate-dependent enzyme, partial [Candidatus Scalindua sp.]|nr:aminotransferase class III-fold pyridoxal phosphate-dependent enzyme [Candidatus Scalindua sp.]